MIQVKNALFVVIIHLMQYLCYVDMVVFVISVHLKWHKNKKNVFYVDNKYFLYMKSQS